MKKLLSLTLFLTLAVVSKSQAYVTFGTKPSVRPVTLSSGFGVIFGNGIVLDIEGKVPVSALVENAAFASGSLGYNILIKDDSGIAVTPFVSYSYAHHSNDKKVLNTWGMGGSVRVSYKVFYIQPAYLDKRVYIGLGVIGKFGSRY